MLTCVTFRNLLWVLLVGLSVGGCAANRAAGQLTLAERQRIKDAYSLDSVEQLLSEGQSPDSVIVTVSKRCISFEVDSTAAARLALAGATPEFISTLQHTCVVTEARLIARSRQPNLAGSGMLGWMLGFLIGFCLVALLFA